MLEANLKKWAAQKRLDGLQLSGARLLIEARTMATKMGINDFKGSPHWIFKFMKRNNLVKRAVTSVGQNLPVDWENKLANFKDFVERNKVDIDLSNIGNMDEVPVTFDMPTNFTIAEKGSTDIKITTTGHEKCGFTVVLAVTADCNKLEPDIVFKRKTLPKGKFPKGIVVSANEKGWMGSAEIELWIERVWNKRSGSFFNKKSLLMLDAAPGHKTDSVKNKLKQCQTIPAMIPGGLTKKVQVLDISVNKSFKSKLRSRWEGWMINGYKEYTTSGIMKRASYEEIVGWIFEAWKEITVKTIKNGFLKTDINFYNEEHLDLSEDSDDEFIGSEDEDNDVRLQLMDVFCDADLFLSGEENEDEL